MSVMFISMVVLVARGHVDMLMVSELEMAAKVVAIWLYPGEVGKVCVDPISSMFTKTRLHSRDVFRGLLDIFVLVFELCTREQVLEHVSEDMVLAFEVMVKISKPLHQGRRILRRVALRAFRARARFSFQMVDTETWRRG